MLYALVEIKIENEIDDFHIYYGCYSQGSGYWSGQGWLNTSINVQNYILSNRIAVFFKF